MKLEAWRNSEKILKYIIGGNSLFAVTSLKKNKRVVFAVKRSLITTSNYWVYVPHYRKEPIALFTINMLREKEIMKWAVNDEETDLCWRMFYGLMTILLTERELRPTMTFAPSRKCPVCGKKLIGRESINRGYGPTCYKKIQYLRDIGLLGTGAKYNQ